jgi:hypothetical protein
LAGKRDPERGGEALTLETVKEKYSFKIFNGFGGAYGKVALDSSSDNEKKEDKKGLTARGKKNSHPTQ